MTDKFGHLSQFSFHRNMDSLSHDQVKRLDPENLTIPIAAGLGEEIYRRFGHRTRVFAPTTESDLRHSLILVEDRRRADQTYSVTVRDCDIIVRDIPTGAEKKFETNSPTLVQNLLFHIEKLCDAQTAEEESGE
jgi:hypothetical protein